MPKSKFGHMACPDCNARVVVKMNERETLSYRCDECDGNGYCKKGEGRYTGWMKKIERAPGAKDAPAVPSQAQHGEKKSRSVDEELS